MNKFVINSKLLFVGLTCGQTQTLCVSNFSNPMLNIDEKISVTDLIYIIKN